MRQRTVIRYYCDFCKKAGLSKYHMGRHESACTMNPDRKCRMCTFAGDSATHDLAELIAMLPDPTAALAEELGEYVHREALAKAVTDLLPAFREAAGNCPACMLAALRQKGIPVHVAEGFDFKAESQSIFDDINAERSEIAGYY